jgi:hypothetical protein
MHIRRALRLAIVAAATAASPIVAAPTTSAAPTSAAPAALPVPGGIGALPQAATAVSPSRVLDTRNGIGATRGRLDPGEVIQLAVPAAASGGASSVLVNLTATDALGVGYITAWPCGESVPETSVLNFVPGHAVPNLATVKLPPGGLCFASSASTHLLADLMGWFSGSSDFQGTTPGRIVDTRQTGDPLRAFAERRVRVAGRSGIPAGAAAVAVNVTVDGPRRAGYVVAYPCGQGTDSSTVNFQANETVPTLAFVALSGGDLCLISSVDTDVIVDTFGWTNSAQAMRVKAPARVMDTRQAGQWPYSALGSNGTLEVRIAGKGGIPNDASAALVTLTAVDGAGDGYVTAWPCDQAQPDTSVLNLWPGVLRSNLALVKLSAANGSICVRSTTYNGSPLHLIIDAVGWQTGGPNRQPPPPDPAPTRFGTLPPGSALPSDATCAAQVRTAPEVRSMNATYNATRGVGGNSVYPRVTGDFTGTTDEILQWVACKWGIDEDIVRAQIAKESYWDHRSVGDGGESFGLGQVRVPYHGSAFVNDNAKRSSAYNVDYTYAVWRECYEGRLTWLNQVERGREYAAGDAVGCLGVWFSGRWYTPDAVGYMYSVQEYLAQRIWTTPEFLGYR